MFRHGSVCYALTFITMLWAGCGDEEGQDSALLALGPMAIV